MNGIQRRLDQLAERERKLLFAFLGLLFGMLLLGGPLLLRMSVSEREDRLTAYREVIQQILDERAVLARRQEEVRRVEARYARKAPALASFLAQMADQTGIQIPESQDRSVVPHGKTIKERQTRIRLTKVGMYALSNFMEKISQSGYSVIVSRLDIQKRGSKDDEFDAEMDVSAFDREEVKKPVKEATPAGDAEASEGEE